MSKASSSRISAVGRPVARRSVRPRGVVILIEYPPIVRPGRPYPRRRLFAAALAPLRLLLGCSLRSRSEDVPRRLAPVAGVIASATIVPRSVIVVVVAIVVGCRSAPRGLELAGTVDGSEPPRLGAAGTSRLGAGGTSGADRAGRPPRTAPAGRFSRLERREAAFRGGIHSRRLLLPQAIQDVARRSIGGRLRRRRRGRRRWGFARRRPVRRGGHFRRFERGPAAAGHAHALGARRARLFCAGLGAPVWK